MSEVWKPVPGYEGHYEVSELGRVRSLARTLTRSDGVSRKWPGKILKHNLVGKGYERVTLRAPGRDDRIYVHRLVLVAFVGPCPDGMEVCHWDGDPLNNKLSNLRYDTASNNNLDKWRHGTMLNTHTGERLISLSSTKSA